jgi:hypothetical protein
LYNIDVYGYEANGEGEPPVDEDHRRLLEVVEDEAEPPKMKDHRELQGITIFGDGIATLKFRGRASRRSLRNMERCREQQETNSGRPLGGAQFGIDISVFPLLPSAITSSAPVAGGTWALTALLCLAVVFLGQFYY